MSNQPFYDLGIIKQIPIPEVLQQYGILLSPHNFFQSREEKTPSAKYYPDTNTWYDFGIGLGGSVIELVEQLQQTDFKNAVQELASQFGIPTLNQSDTQNHKYLTNSQYELIGLYGDRAGKNVSFDFKNYTEQQNLRLSKKLAIPMNALYEQYPKSYAKIIRLRAIPYVHQMRNTYLFALYKYNEHQKDSDEFTQYLFKADAQECYNVYSHQFDVLKKCVENTGIQIDKLRPNFIADLNNIKKQRVSIEIGNYPYCDLIQLPGANLHHDLTKEQYKSICSSFVSNVHQLISAFLKGNTVRVFYKEADIDLMKPVFEAIAAEQGKTKPQQKNAVEEMDDI